MSLPRRVVAGFSREVRSFFSLILPNRFACKLKMSAPAKSDPLKRRENDVVDDVAVRSGDGSCGLVRQQEIAQGHDIPDIGACAFDSCPQLGDLGIAALPPPAVLDQRAGRLEVQAQAASAPQHAWCCRQDTWSPE